MIGDPQITHSQRIKLAADASYWAALAEKLSYTHLQTTRSRYLLTRIYSLDSNVTASDFLTLLDTYFPDRLGRSCGQ